jgi:hypothetical protein
MANPPFSLQFSNSFVTTKEIAQALTTAPGTLDDVLIQAIDLFHSGKFLWTAHDHFPGLETTAIEQQDEPSFTLVDEQRL